MEKDGALREIEQRQPNTAARPLPRSTRSRATWRRYRAIHTVTASGNAINRCLTRPRQNHQNGGADAAPCD